MPNEKEPKAADSNVITACSGSSSSSSFYGRKHAAPTNSGKPSVSLNSNQIQLRLYKMLENAFPPTFVRVQMVLPKCGNGDGSGIISCELICVVRTGYVEDN